jgi:hypothetical protein
MSAADTGARREGAGMGSFRAVSGGVESGMFQDEGAGDLFGIAWIGLPTVPPLPSPQWGHGKPNAHAVAPNAPSAPTQKFHTPKARRNLQASLAHSGRVQTSVLPGAPHPL